MTERARMTQSNEELQPLKVAVEYWPPNADGGELVISEIDRTDKDEVGFTLLVPEGSVNVFMSCAAAVEIAKQITYCADQDWRIK